MMQSHSDKAEHGQLPEVEEYKAAIGHKSKPNHAFSGFATLSSRIRPNEKCIDPDGIYRESLALTQDVETDDETYNWNEQLGESQPMPDIEKDRSRKSCFWKACAIITVIILATTISVSLLFAVSPEEASNFYHWIHGDTDTYASIRNYITDVRGISPTDAFTDTSSPQYLAAQWMAHGDGMKLSIPETRDLTFDERYVMAVLYFSLGGQKWENQLGFLSGAHICTWFEEVKVHGSKSALEQDNNALFGVHGCKEGEKGDGLYPHTIYLRK